MGCQTILSWFDEAEAVQEKKPADTVAVYVDDGGRGEDGRRHITRRGRLLLSSNSNTDDQQLSDSCEEKVVPRQSAFAAPPILSPSPATTDIVRALELEEETVRGALQSEWRAVHLQLCKEAQSPVNAMLLLEVEEGERRARVKIVSQYNVWYQSQRPPVA